MSEQGQRSRVWLRIEPRQGARAIRPVPTSGRSWTGRLPVGHVLDSSLSAAIHSAIGMRWGLDPGCRASACRSVPSGEARSTRRTLLPGLTGSASTVSSWRTRGRACRCLRVRQSRGGIRQNVAVRIVRSRENVFTVTATSQELSALVAGARMALEAMRSAPEPPPPAAVEILERVLHEFDVARGRLTADPADGG